MKNLLLSSISFVITLLLTSCGVDSVGNASSLVTPPTLSVGVGRGGEGGGSVTFTVSLSEISAEATTFKYRTEIDTGDTAQQADFTAIGALGSEMDGTISIGETTTTIEVTVNNDTEDDDNETFSLVLSDVSGAVFAGGEVTLTAIGRITDDDVVTAPTLSVGAGTGGEGGSVTFTVSLSEISAEATTFKYRTEIGTGNTAQQADFTAIGAVGTEMDGIISIGKRTTTIEVIADDDTEDDDDETFSLVLSDVSGAVFSHAGTLTAIGTITDNDSPMLSVGAGTGGEGGSVTFNVSLSSTVISDVTFKYRTGIVTGNTADQADFTAIGAVGTEMDGMIAAGSTALDVVVVTTDNTSKDGDKTFSLVLSAVSGVVFSPAGTTLIATGTISDNDVADSNGNGLLDIASAAELDNIRYNLTGTSYKTAENDTGDSSNCPTGGCNGYELIYNIDLEAFTNWMPIQGQADTTITTSDACVDDNSGVWDGTGCLLPAAFFSAIFDGSNTNGGKTISNLTISSSTNLLGLFGVVSGTLKNVKLRDGSITGLATANSAGALAGYLISGGIIEASSSNLAVSVGGIDGYAGGLVGISYGTVRDSYSVGDVTGGAGGIGQVGGLVGYNYSGTIEDSYATGAVTGGDSDYNYMGGLAGRSDGTIQNSYATGAITSGAGADRMGGLVGRSDGTVQNSYATGAITSGAGANYLGGLVGWSFGGISIIQNSNATGDVKGGVGVDVVGGLVGANHGTIKNSNAATDVITGGAGDDFVGGLLGYNSAGLVEDSYAIGDVTGGAGIDYVGGLVGYSDGIIQNSNATGAVTGGAGGANFLGGLMGFNQGIIQNSNATGAVTVEAVGLNFVGGFVGINQGGIQSGNATGAVTGGVGNDYAGGFVGWSFGGISIIQNSNATGTVTGVGGNDLVGGLVGYNSTTIQNSNAAGTVVGGGGDDIVGGLVGSNGGKIQDSNALGAVTGGVGNDHVGGLMGLSSNDVYDSNAFGAVTGGVGNDFVGGLVGLSEGIVQNSSAAGAVTGAEIDATTGAIIGAGTDRVGGLLGLGFESRILNSYALGAVTGGDDGGNELGGLVGYNYGGIIKDSYAAGAIAGGAGAEDVVGGLVGRSYGGSSIVIRNSYALGAVTGGAGAGDSVGVIVGIASDDADIFGNYYTNTADGEIKRVIGTDQAIEKTVAQLNELTELTTETDFTGADTTDGWSIYNWDFTAGKYPSLKSYKIDEEDVQIEGDLFCWQDAGWVQC